MVEKYVIFEYKVREHVVNIFRMYRILLIRFNRLALKYTSMTASHYFASFNLKMNHETILTGMQFFKVLIKKKLSVVLFFVIFMGKRNLRQLVFLLS